MTPNHSNLLMNQALSVYAPTIEPRNKLYELLLLIQPGHEEFISQSQDNRTDKQAKDTG